MDKLIEVGSALFSGLLCLYSYQQNDEANKIHSSTNYISTFEKCRFQFNSTILDPSMQNNFVGKSITIYLMLWCGLRWHSTLVF